MIDESYRTQIWKYYSARGWRKNEPLDDELATENPRLLSRSIQLLVDEKVVSKDELLSEICLNAGDVESLSGLPKGFLGNNLAELHQFPTIKVKDVPAPYKVVDNVIEFNKF
jgi:hypothetical protein